MKERDLPKYCYRRGRKGYIYFVRYTFIRRMPDIDSKNFDLIYQRTLQEHDDLVIAPDAKASDGRMIKKTEVDKHFAILERGAKQRAKKSGRDYTLPKSWGAGQYFRQNGCCALSGVHMRKPIDPWDPYGPSIDRIDSELGYTPENCQLVALQINRAKNSISEEEFVRMCERVIKTSRDKARTERENENFSETPEIEHRKSQ